MPLAERIAELQPVEPAEPDDLTVAFGALFQDAPPPGGRAPVRRSAPAPSAVSSAPASATVVEPPEHAVPPRRPRPSLVVLAFLTGIADLVRSGLRRGAEAARRGGSGVARIGGRVHAAGRAALAMLRAMWKAAHRGAVAAARASLSAARSAREAMRLRRRIRVAGRAGHRLMGSVRQAVHLRQRSRAAGRLGRRTVRRIREAVLLRERLRIATRAVREQARSLRTALGLRRRLRAAGAAALAARDSVGAAVQRRRRVRSLRRSTGDAARSARTPLRRRRWTGAVHRWVPTGDRAARLRDGARTAQQGMRRSARAVGTAVRRTGSWAALVPRRAPRHTKRLVGVGLVGVLAVAAVGTTLLALQERAPVPPPAAGPPAAAVRKPLVVVVGGTASDAVSDASGTERWSALLARAMEVRLDRAAADGAGYVTAGASGATFEDEAAAVPRGADVIVFFGGGADATRPPLDVVRAASRSFAAVLDRAPAADLVVVGPTVRDVPDRARGRAFARAVRTATAIAGGTWVDPAEDGWLSAAGGEGAASVLTRRDEATIAARLEEVLRATMA